MQHYTQIGLADRWQISPRTLEQWRWQGRGPLFLKIGGRVIYRLSDIEAFEAEHVHSNTVASLTTWRASPVRPGAQHIPQMK